ncbi:tetratricopeptide repeat protein [Virgibacillus ainsalahensis]
MNTNQLKVLISKKKHTLTAQKLVIYKQSKIIEATDENTEHYYLFFYKDNFLNGIKTDQIQIGSHVHRACKHGIHFNGSHPLTGQLIRQQKALPFLPFDQFFKHVQNTYTHIESALITTYVDSFTSPDTIHKLLKEMFYHYQRNGQSFKAYQVLKIHIDYDSGNSFALDMINNLQFQRYESVYETIEKMAEKDPIQFESVCFEHLDDDAFPALLLSLYKDEHRSIDELAVRISLLNHYFTEKNFEAIQKMNEGFSEEEQLVLLQELNQTRNSPVVTEKLISRLLATGNPNEITEFIMTTNIQPKEEQLTSIITSFEQADCSLLSSFFKTSNQRLLKLGNHHPHTMERLIRPFVSTFLQDYDLDDIIDWLTPFRNENYHLPIEQKLKKMQTLSEDPDRQFDLGELYVYFHQFEKSIDCFKWDMELYPEDPKPVNYLSKVYQEIGNAEEASVYRELLMQMQR